jgi:DNA polymerase
MSETHRSTFSTASHWEGFLPQRAIVMAKIVAKAAPDLGSSSEVQVEGDPKAQLVFVSAKDTPLYSYSGDAGELLDKMLQAMGLRRDQVCLCFSDSIDSLLKIRASDSLPKIIVALGQTTAQALLESTSPISQLRSQFHDFRGTRLMCTYHPSDLLTHSELKRDTWSDLQKVARELGLILPTRKA